MNKLKPSILGNFNFDLNKYPFLTKQMIETKINEFVTRQYPSSISKEKGATLFSNKIIRYKVNRAHNMLRAFSQGKISVSKKGSSYEVNYEGKLTRGVAMSALYTLIICLVFLFAAPSGLYFTPLLFVVNYLLQVYLTHIVFPASLGKALHEILIKYSDANT